MAHAQFFMKIKMMSSAPVICPTLLSECSIPLINIITVKSGDMHGLVKNLCVQFFLVNQSSTPPSTAQLYKVQKLDL